ncbi:MAG: proton-conducting transporter membrane subunit, partial [Pricia sp.]
GEKFWPIWFLLLSGLNALYLSGDAFNLYVCLEIIGLASAGLIAIEQGRDALIAALRYLLVGLLGSLFYLLGVAILYRSHGTLDLAALAELNLGSASESVALMLIMSGLILKAALFPLHFWLPSAHASAPAPASAILSALVVKASLYLALRYWFDVLHISVTEAAATLLGTFACAAIVWGSWQAFKAERLKLMVAYSTVAQLGYMFLVFALASRYIDSSSTAGLVAIQAVVYFIVAHAFAKAAMFLTAGNILLSLGHDEVARFGGLAKSNPLAIGVFAIAGASLIGLPPSAGFIAKWLLLNAAIENGNWLWLICIVVGGLLATLYIFRVLIIAFDSTHAEPPTTPNSDTQAQANPVPGILSACALSLAVGAMILGVNAEPILNLVNASSLAFYFSG